ncbi:hypothetical protein P4S72_01085 [Vibrio sp. PP-XX7]
MKIMGIDSLVVVTTLKLAFVVMVSLLLLGIPIAWWLCLSKFRYKGIIEALLSLPLVLPPTVLGFYLLILFSPTGMIGTFLRHSIWGHCLFHLLVLPWHVQFIPFRLCCNRCKNSFQAIGPLPIEVAATLRASPWDRFFR